MGQNKSNRETYQISISRKALFPIIGQPWPWHISLSTVRQKNTGMSTKLVWLVARRFVLMSMLMILRGRITFTVDLNAWKRVVSSVLAISSDCAAIWDNLPKTPEPNMSWHNGISLFRIFPRLLQVGVVSRKYGTPYCLANLMITSLFTGSIGRYIVTPLTLLDGYLKV